MFIHTRLFPYRPLLVFATREIDEKQAKHTHTCTRGVEVRNGSYGTRNEKRRGGKRERRRRGKITAFSSIQLFTGTRSEPLSVCTQTTAAPPASRYHARHVAILAMDRTLPAHVRGRT